jgi:hypothetical protein
MTSLTVFGPFVVNPFVLLAIGIAYWAIFRPDSPALKRRVIATVALLLFLAASSGPLRAQEREPAPQPSQPIMDPCSYLEPYSAMWWFAGCFL